MVLRTRLQRCFRRFKSWVFVVCALHHCVLLVCCLHTRQEKSIYKSVEDFLLRSVALKSSPVVSLTSTFRIFITKLRAASNKLQTTSQFIAYCSTSVRRNEASYCIWAGYKSYHNSPCLYKSKRQAVMLKTKWKIMPYQSVLYLLRSDPIKIPNGTSQISEKKLRWIAANAKPVTITTSRSSRKVWR